MIHVIADNITSPLGMTTKENLEHVCSGDSALTAYEGRWRLPEPFVASLFSDEAWDTISVPGLSRFESLVYTSVKEALTHTNEEVLTPRTCFILSTTKANIESIEDENYHDAMPAEAAAKVARLLGCDENPFVVCNACISGVSAQALAKRLLETGVYDHAIVTGCDVQSRFIVSGFQSLKATSDSECRPFDIERHGLNLGEAAATIILSASKVLQSGWCLQAAAITNDAIHITNPSPKGTGSAAAINNVLEGWEKDCLAILNVHGTATMYNDQMESKAIDGVGLSDLPTNALKGYYGHTMGAAGVLETVLSLHSVDKGVIPGSRNFEELGVSCKVNISNQPRPVSDGDVLKIISGFGGCNGAVLYTKHGNATAGVRNEANGPVASRLQTLHTIRITTEGICLDGENLLTEGTGSAMLTSVYKKYVGDYPKFYKMDILCKLGFVASELLLQKEGEERFVTCKDRAVVLMNHSSSLCADLEYQKSIANDEEYFPSPSMFVYTLPNIVTGEIAIRNKYEGETSFYILGEKNQQQIQHIIEASFMEPHTRSMMAGWIDAEAKDIFEAEIKILKIED